MLLFWWDAVKEVELPTDTIWLLRVVVKETGVKTAVTGCIDPSSNRGGMLMRLCGPFWSPCRVSRFRIFGLFLLFITCACCSDFSSRLWVWWALVIMYCPFMRAESKLVTTKPRSLYTLFLAFFPPPPAEAADRLALKCPSVALLRFTLGMAIAVRPVEVLFILTVVKTGAAAAGRDEGLELVSAPPLRLRFSGGTPALLAGIALFIWAGLLDPGKLSFDLLRFRFDDDLDFDLDPDLWLEFNTGFCLCCVRGSMAVKSYGSLESPSNWGSFGRLDSTHNFL